jgi:ribonuclease VapC
MTMVLDTSALLALFFNERHGPWVEDRMREHKDALRMSTVNLAEVMILVQDRQPQLYERIREELTSSPIRFVPPTVVQAELAAKARMKFPINLGDCFAYALAKDEGCSLMAIDRGFRKTDADVLIP